MLGEFLEKNQQLFADDFIPLEINAAEMENGPEVARRLRGKSGSLPWTVMLDAAGNVLATSDGPEGNFGYPATPEKIDLFIGMLRAARPGLTPAKGEAIRDALLENAKRT